MEWRAILVTFNTEVDKGMLDGEAQRYGLTRSKHAWHCLMRKYAMYCGELQYLELSLALSRALVAYLQKRRDWARYRARPIEKYDAPLL